MEAIGMRKNRAQQVLALASLAVLLFAVSSWAKIYTLQATSVAPGATGAVDAKAAKAGGNTNVAITVNHLARPTLLTPPANEYVVWLEPQGESPENEGILNIGDNEKGDLKVTTTASKFAVVVTAETEAHPQNPSNRVVLRSDVQE
jgi:hypothetical protein